MRTNKYVVRALLLAIGIVANAPMASAQPSVLDLTVTQTATGGGFTCVQASLGGVFCWGSGFGGALGDGTTTTRSLPADNLAMPSTVTVTAGSAHACALTTEGAVYCWGWNNQGQVGDGTITDRLTPVAVSGLSSGVVAISARGNSTCALTRFGGVKCWGDNGSGQLGNGTTTNSAVPVDVVNATSGIVQISTGESHACGLTRGNGVKCWGNNVYNQLGSGGGNSSVAVDVLGLSSGVARIAAGGNHTCALTSTGDVQCWGYNGYGQTGDGNTGFSTPTPTLVNGLPGAVAKVAAASNHTCALTAAGAVWCWGSNDYGNVGDATQPNSPFPVPIAVLQDGVVDISATEAHSCASMASGGLRCWGYNGYGQLGNGATATVQAIPVAAKRFASAPVQTVSGAQHSCVLTSSGGVKCWGDNQYGQLGDNTTTNRLSPVDVYGLTIGVKAIAAGANHTCAITSTNALQCWGQGGSGQIGNGSSANRTTPATVTGLTSGVVQVAAGDFHTCAIQGTSAKCWGSNLTGALGTGGSPSSSSAPVSVSGTLGSVIRIAAGGRTTCAVTASGAARCWGSNESGQVGAGGALTNRTLPVAVLGLGSGVTNIDVGGQHACAVQNGGLICWGRDVEGQVGAGATSASKNPTPVSGLSSGVISVSAALVHSCAVTDAGAAFCWGNNASGRLGDGTTNSASAPIQVGSLTGVVAVAAGNAQTCAATGDGALACWGSNSVGQLGDATTTSRLTPTQLLPQQTISFVPPTALKIGVPKGLQASASSGLLVDPLAWSPQTCGFTPLAGQTAIVGANPALCGFRVSQIGSGNVPPARRQLLVIPVSSGNVPGAPQIAEVAPGDGSVVVAFVPQSDGGEPILSFTATCGGLQTTGTSSPLEVEGLANEVPVTCTVLATNMLGNGPASSPSEQVTPSSVAARLLTVDVASTESGQGSVKPGTRSPCVSAANDVRNCTYNFSAGTLVHLVATPGIDSGFGGWTGACSSQGAAPTCDVTMNEAATVGVIFRGPRTLTIRVHSVEAGTGYAYASAVSGTMPAFTCDAIVGSTVTCTSQVRPGDSVAVSLIPHPMSVLDSASGCDLNPMSREFAACFPAVVMNDDVTVEATFRGPRTLTIQTTGVEAGLGGVYVSTHQGNPLSFECTGPGGAPTTCSVPVRAGDSVYVYAYADPMSVLESVTGCPSEIWPGGSGGGCFPPLVVNDDITVAAAFRGPQTLTIQTTGVEAGRGGVYVSTHQGSPLSVECMAPSGAPTTCTIPVRVGDSIYVYAFADPMSVLESVTGCPSEVWPGESGGGCFPPLVVNDDTTVVATFHGPQQVTVEVASVENGVGIVFLQENDSPYSFTACQGLPGQTVSCTVPIRLGNDVYPMGFPDYAPGLSTFVGIDGCEGQNWGATWGGACFPSVVVDDDKTFRFTFKGPQTLTVVASGTGSGVVDVTDIGSCPSSSSPCTLQVAAETTYQLNVAASPDSDFLGWSGACTGTNPTCTVGPGGPMSVGVNFKLKNRAPIAAVGGPYSGGRRSAIAFNGSGSTDPDGDALSYAWNFGDGATGSGATPNHIFTMPGTFTVTLVVNDGVLASAPATTTVTVTNAAPVASAGGPYTAIHHRSISFSAAASFDSNGDPLTYQWDFGDGSSATGRFPTHSYASVGVFTVSVVVSDGVAQTTASTTATITNIAPVASAGGPYTANKGQAIVFAGSGSDANGDGLTYSWNFGDGSTATGSTPTHAYATTGEFTVTLIVNDGASNSLPSTTTASIPNRKPYADGHGPYSGVRGQVIAFNGTAFDPDGDALAYSWTFGDGGTGSGPAPTHAYAAVGTYPVTLVVHDGITSSDVDTTSVTITNQLPIVNAGGPYSAPRGEAIQFVGSATDADGDPLTYSWTFGDGGSAAGASASHAYSTVGTFTAELSVNDGISTKKATVSVSIVNRAPTVAVIGPYAAFRNQSIAFSSEGSADADGDPLTYSWTFGDGGTATGATAAHSYSTAGTFTATLVVSDGMAARSRNATVTISNQAPVANPGGPYTGVRNFSILFDGTGSHDPENDGLTYTWNFGDGTIDYGPSKYHKYLALGTYTVTLTVSDGVATSAPVTTTVTIANRPPTLLYAMVSASAPRNMALSMDANASDLDEDPLTFTWDFGDGASAAGKVVSHAYTTIGTYTVTLTVGDGIDTVATTRTVEIRNQKPSIQLADPLPARNEARTLNCGIYCWDADGDPITYLWDFGDGATSTEVAPTHTWMTLGPHTLTLTVNDGYDSSVASRVITVRNYKPWIVNMGLFTVPYRNTPLTMSATGGDQNQDVLTFEWDYGDGTQGTGNPATHSYSALGTYTVTVRANDGTELSDPRTMTVTVTNRQATARHGGPYDGNRTLPILFNGSASSDPDNDALTYEWNFGDGTTGTGVAPAHQYPNVGSYSVTLRVHDGTSYSSTVTTTVSIYNRFPVPAVGGPYSGFRNEAVAFDGSASADPDSDPLTYAWTFGDGGTANGVAPSHTYAASGTYTVILRVSDGLIEQVSYTSVTIANRGPLASVAAAGPGVRGQALPFSGAGSTDPEGDALTYSWNFGDGGTASGVAPTHVYTSLGAFTVTLTVNDGAVSSAPATTTVTINNQGPTANAGGPYTGARNTAVVFSGVSSLDPDGDALSYAWDFGNGGTGTGATPTHSYTTIGTFTVTLTVNDGTATSAPVTTTVAVSNRAPVANVGGPYSGVRNAAVAFNGGASTDPDGDGLTYAWDFGDGGTGTGALSSHAYATVGTFAVTLTVSDGTASSSAATTTVSISNQAPIANAGGPYTAVRGQAIAFSGASSSDPDGDSLNYSWNFGDGGTASAASPSHAYATLGTFTATLIVNDGTTSSSAASATVTITNRAPVANAGGPQSGTRLAPIAFNGSGSSDPDGDALTYAWNFGDGATGTGAAPNHLYGSVGAFTVSLTVSDGTGSSAPSTTTVTIANVAPTTSITSPASGSAHLTTATVGLTAAASDSDGTITKVEFFAGAVKVGESTVAPYGITWGAAPSGTYAITSVATDNNGGTATSAPISVIRNAPPSVSLTAPANNTQYASPASIVLTATASDSDGAIANVEFFRGATSLGNDSSSPYTVTWSGATVGAYALTAVATDNRGAVVTSSVINVQVTAALQPTADAEVRGSNSNTNYGSATTFAVVEGNNDNNRRWTYLKFDLASIPTITNAKVRVFGAVSATTGTTIQTAVYPVTDTSWTESGIKWSNKPASGATALSNVTIVNNSTTNRWYELDVTAYLQAEKAAGRNVVTLALKNLATSSPYVSLSSRETGTSANRPHVLIVP